jgi:mono/diheme cytochrome c family protein
VLAIAMVTMVAGCSDGQNAQAMMPRASMGTTVTEASSSRWYSKGEEAQGYRLFQANCASCHQADASGTSNWRTLGADGHYPPPPLNGTAHTWHHSLSVLRRTVREGGVALGGSMPPFADKLNDEEIDAILAWVQSKWPAEVYAVWNERNPQANR